jgi:hypothetical protein
MERKIIACKVSLTRIKVIPSSKINIPVMALIFTLNFSEGRKYAKKEENNF